MSQTEALFSESNSRFLIEVEAGRENDMEALFTGVPLFKVGAVASHDRVIVQASAGVQVDMPWRDLFDAWHAPLNWA